MTLLTIMLMIGTIQCGFWDETKAVWERASCIAKLAGKSDTTMKTIVDGDYRDFLNFLCAISFDMPMLLLAYGAIIAIVIARCVYKICC